MAVEVVMPRLGWTMEEGSIVEWHKRDGDAVTVGEVIFAIESDKAVHEFEALDGGILRIPPDAPALGTAVPIGTVLAYLVAPGEPAPFESDVAPSGAAGVDASAHLGSNAVAPTPAAGPLPAGDAAGAVTTTPGPEAAAGAEPGRAAPAAGSGAAAVAVPAAASRPSISPRARRVATELGVEWGGLTGSGRSGRIVERDVRAAVEVGAAGAAASGSGAARVSPLARRMAESAGLDADDLARARPGGRLMGADVTAAAPPAAPAAPAPPATTTPVPLPGTRRLIASRLSASARTTVPVTLTTEADATRLVALREEMVADLAGSGRPTPTYTDLLLRLTATALTEHPALNASLVDEGIVQHAAVHIGLAVDAERGLLVPVVRDADRASLRAIAAETARLIAAARDGSIGPDDLRGATFTITNLGMYEIDAFTPVINLPECAILGLGRIVARPAVVDEVAGTIAVRRLMALSLTFDHRLVDGAPAARFLQRVKQLVERPTLWLTA